MTKVCFCRGIKEEKIIETIREGNVTYEEIKEKTGAGTGGCCGARCKHEIEKLIEENK
ncbi:(2Fe-2S)-binding protein [uncultured Clostridium sp.]|uniref:(2Fe-2S)-binding protein n=1 Tax=uncultured Clostridium sp. TaxID=59620 RepID=UPI0025DE6E8B|nr:(2Fe-2S)-binding protein [uncultured Clostridium sp.]